VTRGAPDDSNVLSTSAFYRLDDMAELAVRLGSPLTYRRSGNVLFQTTFEQGLTPITIQTPFAGGTFGLVNTPSMSGGVVASINYLAVAGSGGALGFVLPPVFSGRIGVSAAVRLGGNDDNIRINIISSRPDHRTQFMVRLYPQTDIGTYYDTGGVDTQFTDNLHFENETGLFFPIKLIVDLDTEEYVQLLIGGDVYEMAGLKARSIGVMAPYWLESDWGVISDGTGVGVFLLDNVILTRNEV